MEFCELVRTQRKRIGKTLEEVGKAVGVAKATVQRWESGEIKDIRREKLVKLAVALETTPAYLMGWDSPKWEKDMIEDYWRGNDEEKMALVEKYGVCDEIHTHYIAMTKQLSDICASKQLNLTDHERNLIVAYRSHPEMQAAVNTLLGVSYPAIKPKNA